MAVRVKATDRGHKYNADSPLNTEELKIHCKFDDREPENFEIAELSQFEFLSDSKIKVYLIPTTRQESFTYDSRGNRTTQSEVIIGSNSHSYTYYPGSDRLISDGEWAFAYDANGNMVKKGNRYTISGSTVTFDTTNSEGEYWEYGYDCFNRLEWAEKNGTVVVRYLYDPTGLRIAKLAGDGTVLEKYDYSLDGNLIYHEVPSSNQIHSYVWLNGQILARVDGVVGGTGTKYFYHDDHLGSPEVITNETGEVVWKGKYTPFGERIENLSQDWEFSDIIGFTGKDWDQDVELYYFNARWMDPETGRFISEDPVADPKNPNLYSYCANNPIALLDPSGLWYYTLDEELGNWYGVAEKGDILWGLSEKAYGTGDYAEQLQQSNNIDDPTTIQPGDFILMGDYNDISRGLHGDLIKFGYMAGGVSYDTIKSQGFNPWSLLNDKEQAFMAKQYKLVNELYKAGSISEEQYNKEMFRMESQDGKAVKGNLYDLAYGSCSAANSEMWLLGGFAAARLVKTFGPVILSSPIMQKILGNGNVGELSKEGNSFRFGQYSMRILEQEEVFVRYFGNKSDVMGRYFTSPNGISGIQFLDRMKYSLGYWNSMQGVAWFRVPAGTVIYEGQAAAKFPWLGGGYQVFISNPLTQWLMEM